MPTMTHILLSAGYPQTLRADGGGGISLAQPPNNHRQTDVAAVSFTGLITTFVGAPTTWSLGARLAFLQPHTSGYQYTRPEWIETTPEYLGARVTGATVQADGLIQIADQAAPLGHGFGISIPELLVDSVRIHFKPTFSGGTTPGLRLALTMTEK